MSSYHIGSLVSENLRYKQTDRHPVTLLWGLSLWLIQISPPTSIPSSPRKEDSISKTTLDNVKDFELFDEKGKMYN